MKTLFSLFIALSFGVTVFGQNNTPQTPPPQKSTTSKSTTSSAAAGQPTSAVSQPAQQAPAAVTKGFEQKFPAATKVIWGKANEEMWKATFVYSGSSISANFGNDGTWLETDKSVAAIDMPKAIADAIKASYPTWTVSSIMKIESAKNGISYQVRVKNDTERKSLSYKEDGTPVTK